MKIRLLSRLAAVVGLAALFGWAAYGVRDAKAACSIYYVSAFSEWQSNGAGSFGTMQTPKPDVDVTWTSHDQGPWTLYGAATPGNSANLNLDTQSVSPSTYTITTTDEAQGGGDRFFTIIGALLKTGSNGTYQLSNWDGTSWQCADSHDVTILKP
jgi:hypothetical protein